MKTATIDRQTLGGSHFGASLSVLTHGSEFDPNTRAFNEDETRGSLLTESASLQGNI